MESVALARAVDRMLGPGGEITGLARLSGGANMESWSFDRDVAGYVLRRAPTGAMMAGRRYDHATEAALVRTAHSAGVRAPEVVGELAPGDDLGTGYLMRRVEAEVRPDRILADPPPALIGDLARELARIHAIPIEVLPRGLTHQSAAEMVAELRDRFLAYGGDRPVMALALAWLASNLPDEAPPAFLHGDFRIGNLMVDRDGLSAVLDWELCHLGDRHQDLAFGCINSWRFGHIDRPAFGVGQLDDLFAAYQRESGVAVDPARFRFWSVYSTLWWGLCCLEMADIWRSGRDASLERVVIGRRASETEVDLLMLLEEDAPDDQRHPIPAPEPAPARRQGEPSAPEMLDAIAAWIAADIKPRLEGHDRFVANVALNALGMLARERANPHDRTLSEALLDGRLTIAMPGILARLKMSALAKLAADQPRYSALARARQLWCRG